MSRLPNTLKLFVNKCFRGEHTIDPAKNEIFSLITVVKYKGFSLDFGYFKRWISNR